MKPQLALLVGTSILSIAVQSFGQAPDFERVYSGAALSGFYGGVSAIYLNSSDWDDSYGAGLEVGYRFAHEKAAALRHGPNLETGYYWIKAGRSGQRGDIEMVPLTANYRLAAEVVDNIWLYGGGGAGVAFVDIDPDGMSGGSDQPDVWQLFLGMEGSINEWASLRGGYRHLWVDDMKDGDARIRGDDASIFEVGVNFWY
jgi:opacity protein-like surface antigen